MSDVEENILKTVTCRRVPQDFEPELRQPWSGWINPYTPDECEACIGSGRSKEVMDLREEWFEWKQYRPDVLDMAVLKSRGFIPALYSTSFYSEGERFPPEWVDAVITAKARRLNLPLLCSECAGAKVRFRSLEHKRNYQNWRRVDPPVGDWYQVYKESETRLVPISPTLETPFEVCDWCFKEDSVIGIEKLPRFWARFFGFSA